MRKECFGNIADYGKYGMLRFLGQHGISVAVNLYLSDDDKKDDKKNIAYLSSGEYFKYDPELYRHLKEYVIVQKKRDYSFLEASSLISDVIFYSGVIEDPGNYTKAEREERRSAWHKDALASCGKKDLVFLDPDNGFRESFPKVVRDQVKYCYANELRDYYDGGADVVINNSKGTRTGVQWTKTLNAIKEAVPGARLMALSFQKGPQSTYVFVIHPGNCDRYEKLIDKFLHTNWKDMFYAEKIPADG